MLIERQASNKDRAWIWGLYETLLKESISKQWGWDLSFQKNLFVEELAFDKFKIVASSGTDKATYLVNIEPDHMYLKMLLVDSKYQRQGIGKNIISNLIKKSASKSMPLRLSVIKANPVVDFYLRQGFIITDEVDGSIKLEYAL